MSLPLLAFDSCFAHGNSARFAGMFGRRILTPSNVTPLRCAAVLKFPWRISVVHLGSASRVWETMCPPSPLILVHRHYTSLLQSRTRPILSFLLPMQGDSEGDSEVM